jgi:hypothetical protein
MAREQVTKEEAINILTKERDNMIDNGAQMSALEFQANLRRIGTQIGYTPAFRCLVMGLEPEASVRWKV